MRIIKKKWRKRNMPSSEKRKKMLEKNGEKKNMPSPEKRKKMLEKKKCKFIL